MVFIKIYAKDEPNRTVILDWMIRQLYNKGDISLIDLLGQYMDELVIEDNDILGYHDVGWNELDLLKLHKAICNPNNLEIPGPKCRFRKHYM